MGRAGASVRPVGDFDRVYRGAYPRVYQTLAAILSDPTDAAECTQEAFLRAFQEWERWRRGTSPEVWVHKVAIDRAVAFRRKAQTRKFRALLGRLGKPAPNRDQSDLAIDHDVVHALRKMHPRFAAPIVLRYYHGYTNKEIALALGVSERTVVNHMREAVDRLRLAFNASFSVPPIPALATGGLQHADD
jgi:RNA polymerase sigma-70 factor (ECF subfamily)